MLYDNIKLFGEQISECNRLGFRKNTKFLSFEEHPNLLPAVPTKAMVAALKNGEWKGIDLVICGRFGGMCHSGVVECRKLRGGNNEN